MKATIYHNPMCGTSRKTLEILRDSGADVWIHEYLKNPPATRRAQAALRPRRNHARARACGPRKPLAEELGLTRPGVTDDEILDAMIEHPILIERPLVETPQRRPPLPPAGQGAGDSLIVIRAKAGSARQGSPVPRCGG